MPGKTGPSLLFLVAAISVAGLPPLSGFLAKAALLSSIPAANTAWVWSVVLLSSLMVIVGLSRAGVRLFWRVPGAVEAGEDAAPPLRKAPSRPLETAAAVLLILYGIGMTVAAAPMMRYTEAAAAQLLDSASYVGELRATPSRSRAP